MSTPEEAQKAIDALNGKDLGGRALTVNIARPREERPGGGGGGGVADTVVAAAAAAAVATVTDFSLYFYSGRFGRAPFFLKPLLRAGRWGIVCSC